MSESVFLYQVVHATIMKQLEMAESLKSARDTKMKVSGVARRSLSLSLSLNKYELSNHI